MVSEWLNGSGVDKMAATDDVAETCLKGGAHVWVCWEISSAVFNIRLMSAVIKKDVNIFLNTDNSFNAFAVEVIYFTEPYWHSTPLPHFPPLLSGLHFLLLHLSGLHFPPLLSGATFSTPTLSIVPSTLCSDVTAAQSDGCTWLSYVVVFLSKHSN